MPRQIVPRMSDLETPPAAPASVPSQSKSHFPPIETFNSDAKTQFGLMLEATKTSSRERITITERQQMIDWLLETVPSRGLGDKEAKRRSWTKQHFFLRDNILWRKSNEFHDERKVLAEPELWDKIIEVHNSHGHAGQDPTSKAIGRDYYDVFRDEVFF